MSTTAVFYAPVIDDDNGVILGNNSRCIFFISMANNRLVKLSDIRYEDFHASLPYHS